MCIECNIDDHVCLTVPWLEENLAPLQFSKSPSGAWFPIQYPLDQGWLIVNNSFLSRLAVVTGERSTTKWERCGSDYLAAVQVIHSVELSSQEGPYIRSMSVLVKQSSIARYVVLFIKSASWQRLKGRERTLEFVSTVRVRWKWRYIAKWMCQN